MKKVIITALSILILAQAYAFSQAEAADTGPSRAVINSVSITTNSGDYVQGDIIAVSGSASVSEDPLKAFDVTLKVTAPNGNLITVQQATPSGDGYYSLAITSGASWKFDGVYTIAAYYGDATASTSFSFSIADAAAIDEVVDVVEESVEAAEAVAEEVVEAAEVAAEGIVEVAGGLACGSGTHEADGFCIPDGSDSFGLTYDSASANGLILTAAIAFGIAVAIIIALRLIGKAGRS
jgi:hypothetical protein